MSTPVVYITLLLHCIVKNTNLLICFWKNASKGGVGVFEIFCCLPESPFRLLLSNTVSVFGLVTVENVPSGSVVSEMKGVLIFLGFLHIYDQRHQL